MTLWQLKTFLAVLEAKGFSAAALELDTAQSAASYAVAELERELGVKLLERGRFGARPTEVGERVAAHARQMLGLAAAIVQEVSLESGAVRGLLRVATFRSTSSRVMPGTIARLGQQHPELRVKLIEIDGDVDEKERVLHEGRAEVAFVQSPFPEGFICWELLRDPYVALLPKGHPLAQGPVRRRDLLASPLILYEDHKCALNVQSYLQAEAGGVSLTSSYAVREDSTILSMVAQGLGVSVVPALAFEDLPDTVARVPLLEPLERVIGVALLPGSLKIPAVRAFLGVLKERFPQSALPRLELPLSKPLQKTF